MKYPENTFTRALARQEKQVGLWIALASPYAAEVTAPAGYDWALLDMEHSPNEYASLLGQMQAYERSGTVAIVRPEWNDPVVVKRLLDLGARGLLFPMIQSVEEAEKAVAATRYPPRGMRGVSGAMRGNNFGRVTDYLDRVEDELTVIVQLESQRAIAQAEEIAAVDGVSGVFFGPADIAADMGKLGQPRDPEVWALIRETAQKLTANGVACGTLVLDPAFAAELLNDGFTFVACGTDASLLAKGADQALADVRGKIG